MESLPLITLAETSLSVGATSKRNEKVRLLRAVLERTRPDELAFVAPMMAGQIRYGRVGLGYRSVANVLDATAAASSPSLLAADVDTCLSAVKAMSGKGSAGARLGALSALMAQAVPAEQHYIAQLVWGEMRQGALEGVVVAAVAKASKSKVGAVRRALMFSGDLGEVAQTAMTEGSAGLTSYETRLFRPVVPMLAQSAESAAEALERLGTAAFETKLDGARIQVHKDGDDVRVFSRRLNDVTASVPEVVELVSQVSANSVILDGEVIALDDDGAPRPFQETMRRFGRVHDVDVLRREVPLTPTFFDILRVDHSDLVDAPTTQRRATMEDLVPAPALVPQIITADPATAQAFVDRVMAMGHEGVMAKALDVPYEAGKRGRGWLKLKPVHTLDLVILAAEWGHGRRKGWLSNLHLGAYDPDGDSFVMLGKTFKGLTDEMLRWQTEHLQTIALGTEGHVIHVRPELVVEIALNNVQSSPTYPAGLALRFARVKRYRQDKTARQADTLSTVRDLHAADQRPARA